MNKLFIRSKLNPILVPNKQNCWENQKLYNPGVIYHNDEYHLFYRAVGSGINWKSSIGYAVSKDGENFCRSNTPLLVGENKWETRGLEDPRITKIGDTFYMVYAAYDGDAPRLSMAISKDLKIWTKMGQALPNWRFDKAGGTRIRFGKDGKPFVKQNCIERSKSGGIFPEKIDGKFWMLFGEFQIWFAQSDNGISWAGDRVPFLEARQGDYFDNVFVEMGPSPIKTEKGWLVLYHGVNKKHQYQIGFLLLDLANPRKIIYRSKEPIFGPEEDYELGGMVDVLPGGLNAMQKMSKKELEIFLSKKKENGTMTQVTFCCGAVVTGDILRIYYGASDSVICTATAKLSEVLSSI